MWLGWWISKDAQAEGGACVCLAVHYSFRHHGLQPTRLLCLWNSPGKTTGVGGHFLLQGIFLTQGLNPCLLVSYTGRRILYLTSLVAQMVKRPSVYNAEDLGSIPGSGRSPGEGNDNPLQYYCLENPMDRAW